MRGSADQQRAAGDELWRFSLALYARPGVAETLLALQDHRGCDVNLMLFLLWAGASHGRRIDAGGLAKAATVITPVSEAVVAPLRRLRRELKATAGADLQQLRRRVMVLEFAAERRVLHRLAATVAEPPGAAASEPLAAARANLGHYLDDDVGSPELAPLFQAVVALTRLPSRAD